MNTKTSATSAPGLSILRTFILALTVSWLTGCETTGYQKSDVVAWNSQAAAAEIQTESRELDTTVTTLSGLVNQPAPDAKPQYLLFSAALDRLVGSAQQAGGIRRTMWRKRDDYFRVWDKQTAAIQDAAIRKLSQDRKVVAGIQFDDASRQYDAVQTNLLTVISYLQDIRKALSTDLTRQGLTSVQPTVSIASARAHNVQAALTQTAMSLNTLSAQMSSYRVRNIQ